MVPEKDRQLFGTERGASMFTNDSGSLIAYVLDSHQEPMKTFSYSVQIEAVLARKQGSEPQGTEQN